MFELTKWYADAVSAAGDFLVGYCARLRCGRFSVSYSSVLDSAGQRHSLRRSDVSAGNDEIRWRASALGIDARWQRTASGIRKTIYRNEEGAVEWHCLVPGGAVSTCPSVTEGDESRSTGRRPAAPSGTLGYVECLRLTIPPWRLPLRCLRWGRFLSERNSLIWIDWAGDFASRSVFLNGQPATAVEIGDDGMRLADGARLALDRGLVLRSGALGSTVFGAIPGLDRIAPARMFHVEESKWRSCASFERPGQPPDRAWCIHEVVKWP